MSRAALAGCSITTVTWWFTGLPAGATGVAASRTTSAAETSSAGSRPCVGGRVAHLAADGHLDGVAGRGLAEVLGRHPDGLPGRRLDPAQQSGVGLPRLRGRGLVRAGIGIALDELADDGVAGDRVVRGGRRRGPEHGDGDGDREGDEDHPPRREGNCAHGHS